MPKFFTSIDLNKNSLKNAAIDPQPSTAPSSPSVGQIYFDTNSLSNTYNRLLIQNAQNSAWISIPYSGDIKNDDIVNGTIQVGKFDSSSVKLNTIAAPTSAVDLNSQLITNLQDPRSGYPQDAATKAYVDAAVSNLNVHSPANVATTTDLGGTYNSGSKTLTVTSFDGTIDGYTVVNTNRVLVKNQSTTSQNGIYTASISGSTLTLTRAPDYNNDTSGEIAPGDYVLVLNGGQKGNSYTMSNTSFTTLDGSGSAGAITWLQFGQVTNYTPGNGLSLSSGNQFSINTDVTVDLNTAQTLTNKTLTDNTTYFQDQTTNSKKMQFELSGISASNTRTLTVQDADGTIALTSNKISDFASVTSSELAGKVSDETGSGSLVFASSPTLTTPTIGVATATSVNKVAITAPATSATLTLANGSTLATSGANSITLTSTGTTNVTLPTSGTLARIYSTEIRATTTSAITVTHSLNTRNVIVQVYETSAGTPAGSSSGGTSTNLIYTDTAVTGDNTVSVTFGSADNLYYRVVVTG